LDQIVDHFKDERIDVIIGLIRGGLIPAVYLSHYLDKPMLPFNPHILHANSAPRNLLMALPISPEVVRNILIIDDISDTGKTLEKCYEFFTKSGFNCKTTAVYINMKTTIFKPDFTVYNSRGKWVMFPYEKEKEKIKNETN